MSEIWTVVLAAVLVALAFYHYVFRGLDYFEKRGIPCLPPVPFLGNMASCVFRTETLAETVSRTYKLNPEARYVGFFDFSHPVVMLRDPELIKFVTIKNFDSCPDHKMMSEDIPDEIFKDNLFGLQGQKWKDMRALLSPSFTSSKMKILFKLVKECAKNFMDHVKKEGLESGDFEMKDLLTRYTNDVIVTAAFGISVNSLEDPSNDFYLMGKEATNFHGARSIRLFMLRTFPTLSRLFGVKVFGSSISSFYKNLVKSTIAARDAQGIFRPDMLQLMMQARDKSEKLRLTDDDMTAHAFIFYFGGFDTAAFLMCFAVHMVAVNPDVQEKLRAEVDLVLEQCDGDVTYEALHGMQYLDAVFNETLRLHTPGTIVDRLCRQNFELPPALPGLKPFVVQKGVSLWLPIDSIHRDPQYYTDPEEFRPERFCDGGKEQMDPATFMPFGIGPRYCIGNRFALMEAKLVLFELVAHFELKTCSKTCNPLKISPESFVPNITSGVWLRLDPRRGF